MGEFTRPNPIPETVVPSRESLPPLLIFGNGPVVNRFTRFDANHVITEADVQGDPQLAEYLGTTPLQVDATVSHLAQNSANAVAELVARHAIGVPIFSGGETGGKGFGSEAAHMDSLYNERLKTIKAEMQKAGLDTTGINAETILEEEAEDTPLNIIKVINMYTKKDTAFQEMELSVMGGTWHINRIKFLMKALRCKIKHAFAAEEVLRYAARSPLGTQDNLIAQDPQSWNSEELLRIEHMVDPDDSRYYQQQQGVEKIGFHRRLTRDNYWIREAVQFPARLLSVAAEINNDAHLKEVVRRIGRLHSAEELKKLGINPEEDADVLRTKLRQLKWPEYSGEAQKAFGVDLPEKEAKELFIAQWNDERTRLVEEEIEVGGKATKVYGHGWPPSLEKRYEDFMAS